MINNKNTIKIVSNAFLSLDLDCLNDKAAPNLDKCYFELSKYNILDSNQLIEIKIDPASLSLWKENDNVFVNYSLAWVPTLQGKIALMSYSDNKLTPQQCNDLGYMVTYANLNINTLDLKIYKVCNYKIDGTCLGCNFNYIYDNAITTSNSFHVWETAEVLKYIYGRVLICKELGKCFLEKSNV